MPDARCNNDGLCRTPNAIRELKPRPSRSGLSLYRPALTYTHDLSSDAIQHFESDAVLALEDFERFVFVISVLEHYSVHECALLLGCSRQTVREGRTRALFGLVDSSSHGRFTRRQF